MNAPETTLPAAPAVPAPRWWQLFQAALAKHTKHDIAAALGCSRTAVSLVANGRYPSSTDAFAARVLAVYDRYDCPHTGAPISQAECAGLAHRDAPIASPREMRHWRACQGCPHRPAQPKERKAA
ncbi:MAG: LacI family transcriptional regulator [Sulfuritalea sp.]|nr:LacI family transcriptional regulator [Sulfuritalea sp.]